MGVTVTERVWVGTIVAWFVVLADQIHLDYW